MEAEQIEFYFHEQGQKPRVMTAKRGGTLRGALLTIGVLAENESDPGHFYVGECVESLEEEVDTEDGCDEHAVVDIDLPIEDLEIERHRHVHRHRCRNIATDVHFEKTKRHRFSPATTIEVVTKWAHKKFKIDPASASEYVLQICGTSIQPRADEHLGEIVEHGECSACFDLVKEVTPQG